MENITIREYDPADKSAVMELIRLNTPAYFSPDEEDDLSRYLDMETELYYVILVDGEIKGCGGINFADNLTTGKISWDMIHPAFHGMKLGSRLLRYRLDKLESIPGIRKITVRTSQMAYKFYEKHGFVLREIRNDYWAAGFDMYRMEYLLHK